MTSAFTTIVFLLAAVAAVRGARLVIFGDSLSQAGDDVNRQTATQFVKAALPFVKLPVFPPPPFLNGRSSNGKVWGELVAAELGLDLWDYAVLGSTAAPPGVIGFPLDNPLNASKVAPVPVPTLSEMTKAFLNDTAPTPSDIITIVIGGDDLLQALFGPRGSPIQMSQYSTFVRSIVEAYTAALNMLYEAGVRKFIVTGNPVQHLLCEDTTIDALYKGVPDISKAPLITTAADANTNAAILRELIALINKEAAEETILYQMSHLDARVVYFDAAVWTNAASALALAAGLNTTGFCYQFPLYPGSSKTPEPSVSLSGAECADPDQYAFWDAADPSARGHFYLKEVIISTIRALL